MFQFQFLSLYGESLSKLVRDYRGLEKVLGRDHFLMQAIWSEVRRQQADQT